METTLCYVGIQIEDACVPFCCELNLSRDNWAYCPFPVGTHSVVAAESDAHFLSLAVRLARLAVSDQQRFGHISIPYLPMEASVWVSYLHCANPSLSTQGYYFRYPQGIFL